MFQLLMSLNRYLSIGASGFLLLSLPIPAIQVMLGLDTVVGLQIYGALLAGMVLADKPLARLSFTEVYREMAGENLEEATEKFWKEEQKRRRDEANGR